MNTHLPDGRERARSLFFDAIGYYLVHSTTAGVPENFKRPLIGKAYPLSLSSFKSLSTVPLTVVSQTTVTVPYDNLGLFGPFLKSCQDMIVCFENGLAIVKSVRNTTLNANDSSSDQGRNSNMRRVVNLVEIELRFVNAYTGGSLDASLNEILSLDKNAIRAA